MQFTPGQLVIHPHHGPATVQDTITRTVGGVERVYVTLRVQRSDLTVSLPADAAEEVGIRALLSTEQLQEVLDVLQAPSEPFEKQWSRRMKAQQERLLLGDLTVTAAVVRDLVRRDLEGGLAPAEKDLLKKARKPLLGEFVEALGLSDERAEELLVDAVTGRDVPRPGDLAPTG
ncbi:CarD family transcriptional regulator [Ornithinimicrobium cavernae]|uniref:CarD family transcriptional regulator n=1 Tax=Ornithinimicrobium cavernae TaxID=2666047 RepID=UPI000D69F92E|nr:CarD family transcriptional regulator [Ornithinimicrobium cavernae]